MYNDNQLYLDLKKSPYGEKLFYYLENLDYDILYKSSIHGKTHIIRTVTYGSVIAMGEGYSMDDTDLLLLCCSYHDIGRVNDKYCIEHGKNAADLILSGKVKSFDAINGDSLNIALASISAHSDIDNNIPIYMRLYNVSDTDRFYRIVNALKDADNLDRVRVGDLDTSFLRTETAKILPDFAQELFDFMTYINTTIND